MKKQLLLITFFAFTLINLSAQSVRITSIVYGNCPTGETPPRFVEVYVDGTVDVTNLKIEYQFPFATNWIVPNNIGIGEYTNEFIYLVNDVNLFNGEFPGVLTPETTALGNVFSGAGGGDKFRIVDGANGNAVIDIFGIDGQNGETTSWNFEDSYVQRKDGAGPNTTFDESEWDIEPQGTLIFKGTCWMEAPLNTIVTIGKYLPGTLSTPEINAEFENTVISNPVLAGNSIKINTTVSFDKIMLYGLNGIHIQDLKIENNEINLNNNISVGMYLITFQKNSNTFSKKLMIN